MSDPAPSSGQLDTSDLDQYCGQSMGGGQLRDPITNTDIRRWVQGMQYPNPLHYDDDYAAASKFGRIVAPQSFMVNTDIGHGSMPSVFGKIPGTHMIFGGDEWWFYGPRVFGGDQITVERRHLDYRVAETKFAGPTVFGRGDNTHVNQRGEIVSKQRSTSVRYLAEEARRRGFFGTAAPRPEWTPKRLADLAARRMEWIRSGQGGASPVFSEVELGTRLVTCPIGPHSVQSFTTEWRSFISVVWGATRDLWSDFSGLDGGWLPEMSRDEEAAKVDPALGDGMYAGASRGHVDADAAEIIGMPRGYGYGASMGAWALNYVAYWAGDAGFIRHSNLQYRFPPFEGDASRLDGEVVHTRHDPELGVPIVTVELTMTNQDGAVLAMGPIEVELPA
jgi:acyl dehydratase